MANSDSDTQSESKRRRLERSLHKDTVVDSSDRISNLPDSLLCHILSFLPTKEAVATAILSNRWKPLWILVPALDLKYNCCKPISFTYIVYRVLALHIAPSLRSFRLTWYSPCSSFHLDTWIHVALARNVQQLHLEIYLDGRQDDSHVYVGKLFWLPSGLFTCKTVVVLELSGGIGLNPPPSFQFASLKILRLSKIRYGLTNNISTLLSGCPVLEDLSVVRECTDNVISFEINVRTLKRLHIEFKSYKPEPPDYNIEIHTPALEYFRFSGHLRNIVFHGKLAHLIEARVDIYALEDWTRVYEIYYGDRIFKLLRALNNAKFLSLFPGDKECIAFGSIYPSMFQNLVRLNFKVTRSNWHVLLALLLVAPNLEVLVVNKHYYHKSQLCWMEPPDGSGYLSSRLTTINFKGYEELEHEVEFINYILKEAIVLNTITIKVSAQRSKESVLKKLSMFPRHSTTCLLTVEIGI
ncbi:hypothetical protein CMV_026688 [Castanea mollissima]|uniref:F-box domain-containing protein n=1 Tax=Castanea mollissima TaxID=60419 RepID=A0A8J4QGR5_9ROSI|nr:hypothetical protein CMV_026688 [Castanea mollissima]